MTLQVSNGFKEQFAAFFKGTFDGGQIRVFSGAQPATSDLAQTGTLLGTVLVDGGAALILSVNGPYIIKDVLVDWVLTTVAAGTAGWFRFVSDPMDAGGISYSAHRFDGAISEDPSSGAEMIMLDTALLSAHTYMIDQFFYTLPPIVGS